MHIKFKFPGSTIIHSGISLSVILSSTGYGVEAYSVRTATLNKVVVHKSWLI